MANKEIKEILALHEAWLDSGGTEGKRANLRGADLTGADLSGATLTGAYLWEANLSEADLTGAKVTLELSEVHTLRAAKVSEGHLPWLTGRPCFGEELPTLTLNSPV